MTTRSTKAKPLRLHPVIADRPQRPCLPTRSPSAPTSSRWGRASILPPAAFPGPLPKARAQGSYPVTFTATDDGIPPQSDAESITITVIEPPRPVIVSGVEVRDGRLRFTFAAQPGKTYLVQAKNSLDDPVWIEVPDIPAPPALVEFAEPLPGIGARYYRVITSD